MPLSRSTYAQQQRSLLDSKIAEMRAEGWDVVARRERDLALSERDDAMSALQTIASHFLPGDHPRLCYVDAVTTLKAIRTEVREALETGCPCVGTPDEEDCPHE